MMALQLQNGAVYGAVSSAHAAPAAPPTAAPARTAAAAAPTPPAIAPLLSLDSSRDDYEDVSDLLRLDHVTGRVEIEMPRCGRVPSFPTESLRRQISFLFDEPIPKPGMQGRKDPVLQDAAWALNWAGASQAATAA